MPCTSHKHSCHTRERNKLTYQAISEPLPSDLRHYGDVIMGTIAPQIISLTIIYSTVYSGADQRKIKAPRHWTLCGEFTGDHEFPVQGPVTRKMCSFDDVIMLPNFDDAMTLWHGLPTALLALCERNLPVTIGFLSQRVGNAGMHVFSVASLNMILNKQSSCQWFDK